MFYLKILCFTFQKYRLETTNNDKLQALSHYIKH